MSFVGIIKCKDGVLMFGDRKITDGESETLKQREILPELNKIFANENVMLSSYGNCTIKRKVVIDGNTERRPVELMNICDDFIYEYNLNLENFINYFQEILSIAEDEKIFCFNAYDIQTDTVYDVIFENTKLKLCKESKSDYSYGGDKEYGEIFQKYLNDIKTLDLSTSQLKKIILKATKEASSKFKKNNKYDPVGEEFDFVEYNKLTGEIISEIQKIDITLN